MTPKGRKSTSDTSASATATTGSVQMANTTPPSSGTGMVIVFGNVAVNFITGTYGSGQLYQGATLDEQRFTTADSRRFPACWCNANLFVSGGATSVYLGGL